MKYRYVTVFTLSGCLSNTNNSGPYIYYSLETNSVKLRNILVKTISHIFEKKKYELKESQIKTLYDNDSRYRRKNYLPIVKIEEEYDNKKNITSSRVPITNIYEKVTGINITLCDRHFSEADFAKELLQQLGPKYGVIMKLWEQARIKGHDDINSYVVYTINYLP